MEATKVSKALRHQDYRILLLTGFIAIHFFQIIEKIIF
jgi:hypothetical protein